jgi:peptidylprolyl isomerase
VAGNDRKRQIARERYERRQAERAAARAKAHQRWVIGGSAAGVVVIALVVLLVILVTGNSKSKPAASASGSPTASGSGSAAASSPPPPVPTTAPGCSTKPSVVATPVANFPLLPSGVSSALSTEPSITVPAGKVPTALQVKDLVVGTGATVTTADSVTVNYLGVDYVTCGEFDSSWSRDEPATFALSEVVPGFTKGIAGTTGISAMKVGGRREIIVPPADGYGTAGSPPNVTGNEELIFVVDVLAASKTPVAASSGATSPAATAAASPAVSVPASTEPTATPSAS